jgi:hypothetical protein
VYPPGTGPPELPGRFQAVPVSTVPREEDWLLLGSDLRPGCPMFNDFVAGVRASEAP